MFKLISFITLMLFSFHLGASQLTAEVYGKLPEKSMLALSPDASRVAYRDTSGENDLVIVIELATGKLIKAAHIDGVNPNNMYFINNDLVVLKATKNTKIGGYTGRHDVSWAYSFNLNTGKIHPLLTQGYGIHKGQGQLGKIIGISTDGQYAYMPAYKNPGSYNLYKVNLYKKRKPRIYQKGTSDTVDFFVNRQGQVVARERFSNEKNLHRLESRIDDEWVEIYRLETPIMRKGFYALTPDMQHILVREVNEETGLWVYTTIDLKTGEFSEPKFSHEFKSVENVLTDISGVAYGVKYEGFAPTYEFFDKKLNARMKGINKVMPDNIFTVKDYTPDWDQIVFYMEGKESPGNYIMYNKGRLGFMASSRPDIPAEAVNDVEEYTFSARDGLTIPTLLTIPKNAENKHLPAILMPHGGPESYDRKGFDYMAQYFASQGYMVIQPQFRGSEGFGVRFTQLGRGEWGRKMQDDLTDAVNVLAKEGRIDKDRVCIVGASYGGYAALAGAVFTPDVYKCVVSINGVSDVERMMDTEKRDYGSDHWVVAYWQEVISKGEFDDDHLQQISPVNFAKNVKAPVLLIHGSRDEVVPVKQSKIMEDALEDEDKHVEYVELDKGDHHLSTAHNRMKAMMAIEKFVKQHI